MSLLRSILDWATGIPAWQADLFRRALLQGDIVSSSEWDEARIMVRAAIGLPVEGADAVTPVPPKAEELSGANVSERQLTLKAMTCTANVNAVPDNSSLPFGHQGITVIYGENGSGKSSFARVLKKACGARAVEDIRPNVRKPNDNRPASADFKILGGDDQEKLIPWKVTDGTSAVLSNVTVFDEKVGRALRDEANELRFAPYGSDSFAHVAKAMDKVRDELNGEKPNPIRPSISFKSETSTAAKLFEGISAASPAESTLKKLVWPEEKIKRLADLQEIDRKARETNLEGKIAETNSITTAVQNAVSYLRNHTSHFSSPDIAAYNKALEELAQARKEQQAQAAISLGNEPLPDAGSSVWKTLYQAAREYNAIAYPEKAFPNIEGDARCVWCMQPLQEEAKARLKRFEQFMEDHFSKILQEKESALSRLVELVTPPVLWTSESFAHALQVLKTKHASLHTSLTEIYTQLSTHHQATSTALREKLPLEPLKQPVFLDEELSLWNSERQRYMEELRASLDPESLKKSREELLELEDEKTLCDHRPQIKGYLDECEKVRRYDAAIPHLYTTGISRKGGDLVRETLTPQLEASFRDELEKMGAAYLAASFVSTASVKGKQRHKITISADESHGSFSVSDVLSEGEQKVISLAGFFAELGTDDFKNPIVLDDPVTSLDHKFRMKIAQRLAKESRQRQVIIFTHDIAFLMEVEKALDEEPGAYFAAICVSRMADTPGYCHQNRPWHTMKVSERADFIVTEVDRIAPLHASDRSRYSSEAAIIYSHLRETWEALVEETLLNGVVKRHDHAIHTMPLAGVILEDADWREFGTNYDKCCLWMLGHTKSRALDDERPSPDEIKGDIKKLRDYRKAMKKKQDEVRSRRENPTTTPAIG